jgi:hypothetical protein
MEDDVYLDLIFIFLMLQAMNRWGYYPLILIGSWTFGTINRIHAFVEPHHHLFWLYCLDIGTASLMVRASWQSWPLNHELVLHKISLCLLWFSYGMLPLKYWCGVFSAISLTYLALASLKLLQFLVFHYVSTVLSKVWTWKSRLIDLPLANTLTLHCWRQMDLLPSLTLFATVEDVQGLFNSIAYGFNASVRRSLEERLDL